jgi:hypothetical protein
LWCGWLPDVFFSSPDAALGDDFGRSAAKATNCAIGLCLALGDWWNFLDVQLGKLK